MECKPKSTVPPDIQPESTPSYISFLKAVTLQKMECKQKITIPPDIQPESTQSCNLFAILLGVCMVVIGILYAIAK